MSKVPIEDSTPTTDNGAPPPVYTQQPQPDAGAVGGYQQPYAPQQQQQYPPPPQQYPPQHQQYPPVNPGQYPHAAAPPVIAVQPPRLAQPYPQNLRDWDTPLFGCCEDATVCVCGYFCGWCMACGIMKEMEESQCYACLCPGQALHAARTKLRLTYGINGSLFDDQLVTQCCFACALCQLKRQLKMFQKEQALHIQGATA